MQLLAKSKAIGRALLARALAEDVAAADFRDPRSHNPGQFWCCRIFAG